MIFPSTKHQIAMAASSTWQALVLHQWMAVLLVHPALDRTVRMRPNQQHLSQHFLGWECGQEENPKPGAEYSPHCLWSLSVVSSGALYAPYYMASSLSKQDKLNPSLWLATRAARWWCLWNFPYWPSLLGLDGWILASFLFGLLLDPNSILVHVWHAKKGLG